MISQLPKYLRQFSFQKKIGLIPRSYVQILRGSMGGGKGGGKGASHVLQNLKIETEIAIRTDIYNGAREIDHALSLD